MSAERTPGPWTVSQYTLDNAFIVKACNNHDALVAALRPLVEIVNNIREGQVSFGVLDIQDMDHALSAARAALAQVQS